MKIAITHVDLPNHSKGGVAMQAHLMANALVDAGHDVTMFSFSEAYAESKYKVRQLFCPPKMRKLQSFVFARQLSKTSFHEFDIVHTHGDNYLMNAVHPQVRTMHGSARSEMLSARRLRRKLYQRVIQQLESRGACIADVCVGVSENTRSQVPCIAKVIPNGVDTDRFYPGEKSANPSILFVGTVGGRKRGELLADAFNKLIKPRLPDAELWSVADRNMEGDGIVNFGRVSTDKITKLFREAWVFSLPSTYEGFGVPYIEAMASGTSVVASSNAGAAEVLCNGEFGIIAEDSDLAGSILELLQDEERRVSAEKRGVTRAMRYSWPRIIAEYENVYDHLLSRPDKVQLSNG